MPNNESGKTKQKKILIIEDDNITIKIIEHFIKKYGLHGPQFSFGYIRFQLILFILLLHVE